ncbi:hypothetical protein HOLleu_02095 [Holothuria leucospilota]|uniref:Uncharacterized protein n=1 Tax=Holothuria leucospilota TaxID=206669 RepID=A0A9Q1CR55_HOLLE|nr:hypothetical protein HOLleu_02095 [Holothuria leucospilota]
MRYSKRKNPIIFGGGQSSFGVTGGLTLKILLIRYLQMRYSEKMNPVVFGGGQRSSGVTRGQCLKTLSRRYLQVGSLNRFHTW